MYGGHARSTKDLLLSSTKEDILNENSESINNHSNLWLQYDRVKANYKLFYYCFILVHIEESLR